MVVNDKHGQFMRTCSHAHGRSIIYIHRSEFILSDTSHGSRSIICRSCQQADERKTSVIFGSQRLFPKVTFRSSYCFIVQYIGIRAMQSGRDRATVENSYHLLFGQTFCKFFSPSHGYLVIPFEKVDLCSGYTIAVHFSDPVTWILSGTTSPCPDDNLHILFFGV